MKGRDKRGKDTFIATSNKVRKLESADKTRNGKVRKRGKYLKFRDVGKLRDEEERKRKEVMIGKGKERKGVKVK